MKTRKQILEKHRKNNDAVPHWITMKDAESAMKEYLLSLSKDKDFKDSLTSLIDEFTGSKERHTAILVDRICKKIRTHK